MSSTQTRTVTVLGSTGSVGRNTLDLIARAPEAYRVEALTANENVDLLVEQARCFRPKIAVIANDAKRHLLAEGLEGTGVAAHSGAAGLLEAARLPAEWVMGAIVGAAGLAPTMVAVERGATVALANKECLVCAGDLMIEAVKTHNATLLPVDSEHNAIFQVFDFDRADRVARILLTASGGPFRAQERDSLSEVSPEQAVKHPNWSMGAKISVDSATMMNKGLELIEAYHIFPVQEPQIEIVVHPQSVIHSMVEYCDGSVLAQLGSPDMRTPIAYTLAWPDRIETPSARLDFAQLGRLDFEAPDPERFPALRMARQALIDGGAAPTILNAANEIAVHGFLDRRIGFLQITDVVDATLQQIANQPLTGLEQVGAIDAEARACARDHIGRWLN